MANGSDRSWDTPPSVKGIQACIADWDPARGLHQGQQSFKRLHKQAEDKTASDPRRNNISSIAMREPSRQDSRVLWAPSGMTDQSGRDELTNAVIDGEAALVEKLLVNGCDPNTTDHAGWSALHFAAQNNDAEIARILLRHGASLSARDNHGNSPLFRAVFA